MSQSRDPTVSMSSPLASPTARRASMQIEAVPLDSSQRVMPIHQSLADIKLPTDASKSNINPLTLQPFTEAELKQFGFEKLRNELDGHSKQEIEKMRDDAVRMLKDKIEDREAKTREIDREIEEKEKIREVERKVYRKKMGVGKDG